MDNEKLERFYEDFLQHVRQYNSNYARDKKCIDRLVKTQQENTTAIASLVQETRDIIKLQRDLQGAARLGKAAQGFALWLAKWGTIGAILAAAFSYVLDQFEELL